MTFEEPMGSNKYKYDVAFSFLTQDEELATKINELIKDRLHTFIYTEKQPEIAGKDGEIAFGNVFRTDARLVFVLYRKGWGQTPWTRIEETAIRDRAYEEGYDFVIFAPLDKPPSVPEWLPKNRIWIGLDRYGIEGAASVIEARAQERGAELRELSAADHAVRRSRDLEFRKKKEEFLGSEKGVHAAREEIETLFNELDAAVEAATAHTREISKDRRRNAYAINVGRYGLLLSWSSPYANTVSSSVLRITLFNGAVSIDGNYFPREEPRKVSVKDFSFDINRSEARGWRQRVKEGTFYTSMDMAKYCIDTIMSKAIED